MTGYERGRIEPVQGAQAMTYDPAYLAYAAWHDSVGYTAWATMLTLAIPTMLWLGTLGGGDQS